MTDRSPDMQYWSDLYFKAQEDFFSRWNQLGSQAAAGATSQGASQDAFRASSDAWRTMQSAYEQYFSFARAVGELMMRSANQPDPESRAREFMNGLTSLAPQLTAAMPMMAPFTGGADAMQMFTRGFGAGELPALGLTRERQESLQKLQRLSHEYMQHQLRLQTLWAGIVGDALKRFGERVGGQLAKGAPPMSIKALYDAWIECGEETYARVAHTPEYAKTQADLGNVLAKLRNEQREWVESYSRQLDLPTRAELNTVHLRLKHLKAEVRRLNSQLAELSAGADGSSSTPRRSRARAGSTQGKARS